MHKSRQPCFGASGGCGSGEVYAHIKQVVEQKSLTACVPVCLNSHMRCMRDQAVLLISCIQAQCIDVVYQCMGNS